MNRQQTMTSPQASAEPGEVAAICDKHGPCTAMVMPGLFGGKPLTVKRCPACTEKHGPAECGPQYVKHLCCGVVPNATELTGDA